MNLTTRHVLAAASAAYLLLTPPAAPQAVGGEASSPGKASFHIRSFGATGDGRTVNTAAVQKAIDARHATAADTAWQEPVDVEFTARVDGSKQRYVLMTPAGFDAGKPVDIVLALHGHGSDRWQFVRQPRDECRGLRDVAARYGMLFIAPDYRAKTSWMGPKAEADVLQILDEVRRQYRVRHTLVAGGSMGGTAALTFAALHPDRVDGVVALNGTANLVEYRGFQAAIAESFGGTKEAIPAEYKQRSAELRSEQLTMPMAATVGGRDRSVPPESVRRLFETLRRQARTVRLIDRPEGGHSTNYADTVEATEFVVKAVRGKAAPSP